METLQTIGLVLAIASPIGSACYVVGVMRAELRGLRDVVDRHERELAFLRHRAPEGVK